MGALLREANTRDVWLFVEAGDIRELWPRLVPYLGRSRAMWAWLLELPQPEWPPIAPDPCGQWLRPSIGQGARTKPAANRAMGAPRGRPAWKFLRSG